LDTFPAIQCISDSATHYERFALIHGNPVERADVEKYLETLMGIAGEL